MNQETFINHPQAFPVDAMFDPEEKPLDTIPADGGFTGIFRCIGCIGDSLSSGEFQGTDAEGNSTYHDMYDYSWGQYMARLSGNKVINMSRGGMSAKWYMDTFADENDFWEKGKECQAYIVALGCNDLTSVQKGEIELGTLDDIDRENYENNAPTVTGYYAAIIQKIFKAQPDVHFFLMTLPNEAYADPERQEINHRWNELIRAIAAFFKRCHLIDLETYAPVYDNAFKKHFFMSGHMNPAGYLLTAKMVASYIDYIVRHHMEEFMQVGFWGTEFSHKDYIR